MRKPFSADCITSTVRNKPHELHDTIIAEHTVFDTPPLFKVEFNGVEVGSVHELSLQTRHDGSDPIILLGGRAWWVRFVDWDKKTAIVEPSDLEGRSRWLGSSVPLSFELCQAMREVLESGFVSQNWSRRASTELGSFGKNHLTDSSGTTIHTTNTGCVWWTFAGLRANALLAEWLRSANLVSRFDNLRLICDYPVPELSEGIRAVKTDEIPLPQKFSGPKFSEAVAESELRLRPQSAIRQSFGKEDSRPATDNSRKSTV